MGLFNKKDKVDAAAKSPSPSPPSPSEDGPPKTRQPYVPRHAARDGMIGAPTGWNSEEQNVVRLENRRKDLERQASGFSSSSSSGAWDARAGPSSPRLPSPGLVSRQMSEMSLDSKLAAASADVSRTSSNLSFTSEASSSRLSGGDWSENNNLKQKTHKGYFSHGMEKTQLGRSPLSTPATSVDITPDTSESGSIESGFPQMRPTAPRAFGVSANKPAVVTPELPSLPEKAATAPEKHQRKWMKRMTRSASPEETS